MPLRCYLPLVFLHLLATLCKCENLGSNVLQVSTCTCVGEAFTAFNNTTAAYLELFFSGCPGLNASFEDNKVFVQRCLSGDCAAAQGILSPENYI